MPIEQSIWKLSDCPEQLKEGEFEKESDLEDSIAKNIGLLNKDWLLIGRQVPTAFGGYIDLLAIDAAGTLYVIELKRTKTSRDVVAQAIDYAAWAEKLEANKLIKIYEEFAKNKSSLKEAIEKNFRTTLSEDELNQDLRIIIVCSELDSSTARIVKFLSDKNIPIDVLSFRIFVDGNNKYISRAWLFDPIDVPADAPGKDEPWNGQFYVSFGECEYRRWSDAIKYGFISAGGGRWYSRTLNKLSKGDRVWVNVPATGYVGVGLVTDTVRKLSDFKVNIDGSDVEYTDAKIPKKSKLKSDNINDEDRSEYVVPVKWIKTVNIKNAVTERGFFGNQNTVCQPTKPKWRHTVQTLQSIWNID